MYIIPDFDAWSPPNFMIAIHVFVFKMHTFKIFQKINHKNIFNLKKYNTNTYQFVCMSSNVCHLKAMLNAMYFKNKHGDLLFFMFYFYFLSQDDK